MFRKIALFLLVALVALQFFHPQKIKQPAYNPIISVKFMRYPVM